MQTSRLTHLLQSGELALPDTGTIAVQRPTADTDLSALPKTRVQVYTGFRPDHDHFAAQGFATGPHLVGQHGASVVFLPRSREQGHGLIAAAAASVPSGAPIIVDGQKTDGIDALWRELRQGFRVGEAWSKAHGKLFVLENPGAAALIRWAEAAAPRQGGHGFWTVPGGFSADGPDHASVLLADALPAKLPGRVADLGAGWGYLSQAILARAGVDELHLIEAEALSLDCARRNISDPRAVFHWADAMAFRPEGRFGAVVMNPPFHSGRAADPALGTAFIRAAQAMLSLSGTLWMVANRHLPYEAMLNDLFFDVQELPGTGAFKLLRAAQPRVRNPAHSAVARRDIVPRRRVKPARLR
ncbi:MAG: class I SAM-dependent methyltransferase [Paracoccaceae bacterium]